MQNVRRHLRQSCRIARDRRATAAASNVHPLYPSAPPLAEGRVSIDEVLAMLRSLKILEHFRANATDGDIGRVVDFLLDDASWTVRYFIVDTDGFLDGREVLITPISLEEVDYSASRLRLYLTKKKVEWMREARSML